MFTLRFHDKRSGASETQPGFAADELSTYKEYRKATDHEKAAMQRYPTRARNGRMSVRLHVRICNCGYGTQPTRAEPC
jgi:hypothetical protein